MQPGHALRRWRALYARQRAWLVVFVAALPLLRLSLRVRGYARTLAMIEAWTRCARTRTASDRELQAAAELARLARIAGRRGLVTAACLPQALAVYAAIRRRGLAPALRIGVRKPGGGFEAHAWVELDGVALDQPHLDHQPLPIPPAASASPRTPVGARGRADGAAH